MTSILEIAEKLENSPDGSAASIGRAEGLISTLAGDYRLSGVSPEDFASVGETLHDAQMVIEEGGPDSIAHAIDLVKAAASGLIIVLSHAIFTSSPKQAP